MMRLRISLQFCFFVLFSFCSQPPRQPDEVRVRLAADPETLNPVSYVNAQGLQLINLLFQSLLGPDLADNELKPVLAEAVPLIEQKNDSTYITYTLREEAEWADGKPVTAADVAFTLKVIKAPLLNNERLKPQFEFIKNIKFDPADSRKFTLVCNGFTPEMELLSGDYFILPSHIFDSDGLLASLSLKTVSENAAALEENKQLQQFASQFNSADYSKSKKFLTGSGGYELESWVSGQAVVLKRKEGWWGKSTGAAASYLSANPNYINFQIIPDNTTALLALKNQQLDVLEDIAAVEFDQLKQNEKFLQDYALHAPDAFELVYVGINSRKPKFSDRRTRQALAHLFDTDNLIKATHQGYATPTVGPIPPSEKAFYHKSLQRYGYNPQRATDLIKAAGWIREESGWHKNIDGIKQQLTVDIIYRAGNTVFENSALIFQQSAAKAGIAVTLQAMEGSMVSQKLKAHDFDMFLRTLHGNPFVFNFKPMLHTSYAGLGGANYTGFGTAESDQTLDAINSSENETAKARLLKRLQEIIHEEAAFLPLYYQKDRLAIHGRFDNTKVSGLKPNYDVSSFTLKQ